MRHNSKPSLESRLRELLDLPSLAERSLVLREDIDEEPEDTNGAEVEENSPFERFNPTEQDPIVQDMKDEEIEDKENWKRRIDGKRIDQLKDSIRTHKFMISLPIAAVVLASTIILTCCCTLYLKNRLVGCINAFKSKEKVKLLKYNIHMVKTHRRRRMKRAKYLTIESEVTRTPRKKAKLLQKKLPSFVVPRARSLSQDYTHVATQNSAQSIEEKVETPPTGCCTFCKKKKKKEREKKRKK